ncbi:MAG: HpcH/HpaI aldolase/citrate lyase family protein, partial [Acidimicrobiales bacterium]
MSARSWLYVPGDQADKLARASERGAEALIIDLEDGVAPSAKARARQVVKGWIHQQDPQRGPERWARINGLGGPDSRLPADDVAAVVHPALSGICLPKCERLDQLTELDRLVDRAEWEAGLAPGTVRVSALIESGRGLAASQTLAGGPRVEQLQLGEADLAADVGLHPGPTELELLPARWAVVLASATAGLDPPIGPVATDLGDPSALRRTTEALLRLGFGGRAAIHPDQIPVINEVFTPTAAEVEAAQVLVEGFESARARGHGVI